MNPFRRRAAGAALAILTVAFASSACADNYPGKPIRFICPFPPGGTVEVLARAIGQKMTEAWGKPVIVDNRPGASGIIGSELAAKAAPDGYTLLMVPVTHATNSSMYSKLPYDPLKDFTPISLAGSQPLLLVVNPSLPVKSVADLVAYAKAKPGALNFGSSGNGTSQHLAAELFKSMTKTDMVHVPYKGSAAALTDVISGQLSLMFPQMVTAVNFVRSGKLRGLAVSSAKRSPAMPELPTIAEAGVPGYESTAWFAVLGPAGMTKDIVAKINGEVVKAVNAPDVRERLSGQGLDLTGSSPQQLTVFLKAERRRERRRVQGIHRSLHRIRWRRQRRACFALGRLHRDLRCGSHAASDHRGDRRRRDGGAAARPCDTGHHGGRSAESAGGAHQVGQQADRRESVHRRLRRRRVAALAGAPFMLGRPQDGLMQPITSYVRVLNVDMPRLVSYCEAHRDDLTDLVLPDTRGGRNEDYVMAFLARGFGRRVEEAKKEGFRWIVPKNTITLKTGLIPGELNINVTRFQGSGLDDRTLSRAEIEIRKQAYCAFDFLKRYVAGFEQAIFLEVAPKLGVRETRRIRGAYVLTEADVRGEARFEDAIGLCNSPIDIHEPGGSGAVMHGVGGGYGIPFRCLVPEGIEGLFVAGRCMSVDAVAFGSTRNVPACASSAEAVAVAAAHCARNGVGTADVPVKAIQQRLRMHGIVLGTPDEKAARLA